MPILAPQAQIHPIDLLQRAEASEEGPRRWWVAYTLSRKEKALMRWLLARDIPFYGPTVSRRYRSPGGRVRTVYAPLFSNYVFIWCDEETRSRTKESKYVSHHLGATNSAELVADLRQLQRLIALDKPLSPEARLEPGNRVRVRNGSFAGFEGVVIRRSNRSRLVVDVRFVQQGVSVELDDCQLDRLT